MPPHYTLDFASPMPEMAALPPVFIAMGLPFAATARCEISAFGPMRWMGGLAAALLPMVLVSS